MVETVVMAGRLEFVLGDLAREEVDAIVNPSNSGFLLSFSGVNGALLEAAGEELADGVPQSWARGGGRGSSDRAGQAALPLRPARGQSDLA